MEINFKGIPTAAARKKSPMKRDINLVILSDEDANRIQ
jgi:hypothetical protein